MAQPEVFLSYRSSDRVVAERIAQALRGKGLRVFFDQWWLTPGRDWRAALEQAMARCSAFAVLIGPRGLGPWQQREVSLALLRVDRGEALPIVPIRLPNADAPLSLLDLQQWVALDEAVSDERALELLARGLRGEPPGPELDAELREGRAGLCPFRGLLAFREEDAAFFVGREEATAQLRRKLEVQSFVAVVGASGTGKSSLVHAGLVPALRRDPKLVWDVIALVPDKRPLHSLAAALLDRLRAQWQRDELRDRIEDWGGKLLRSEIPLAELCGDALKEQPGTERLLLFVDQFEETFALCQDQAMRERFLAVLLDAAQDPRVRVVLTLRADFYGHLQAYRPLTARLDDCVVNVGPLDADELERVIVEPARKVGLEVEDALVAALVKGVGEEPGRLPLLQFVLEQMWRESGGRRFDHATYDAVGGLEKAIAHRAEQVFAELDAAQKQAATTLFLRLVQVGEGTRDTRERALLAGADPALRSVVERLARGDARLLVTSRDEGSGADAIEISHEALIPSWTWLRELVQQNRQFLAWRKHTRAAVRAFAERHEDAVLLRGRYLAEAMEFRAARADDLTPEELSFVAASVAAAARRKLLLLVGVTALLALSITASIGFLQAKQRTAEFELLASVVTLRAARETEATLSPPWPEKLAAMDEWLDRDVPRLRDALPKLKIALASLELRARPRIGRDARLEFDAESDRFLFETLRSQDQAMEEFLGSSVPRVKQRRAWAKRLDELSRTRDATRWAAVSAAIRAKHGFDLKPQGGLVPLGANPKTGYFEFYELRSAWDGKSDPASIAIPAHDEEGRIAVKDETGIVFVLLPGGAVTLGAQDTDPKGPNYETGAESDEDVHEVRLAPFFLARHELTQAQYLRLTGERNPSSFAAGERTSTDERAIGWAHPVENLDWDMARQALEPHGLILPTEAQWEYGCRGGTTTAWYAGSEARDLRGHARLSDSALEGDPLQDQWSAHWPVGAGSPNAFGLFDVHGNVWEWCRDWYGAYGTERPGDGIRGDARGSGDRVIRGGSFSYPASVARSADRSRLAPSILLIDLGLRAARIITE